jgi:hypothetical protein
MTSCSSNSKECGTSSSKPEKKVAGDKPAAGKPTDAKAPAPAAKHTEAKAAAPAAKPTEAKAAAPAAKSEAKKTEAKK